MTDHVQESQTAGLADFAVGLEFPEPPAEVLDRLEQCLLDFVGVAALGARQAESSAAIRQAAAELAAGRGESTVIGESGGWPVEYAAFLNGAYAHSLDFDDTYIAGGLHPGAAVIPAALAEAGRADVSGARFLTALAVGYETGCRVGEALGKGAYLRGFHPTAVAGIFGAVAAAARLRGLTAEQLASAFGLAGSMAAGSMQYLANGAWNKRLHPGLAARNAMLAVTPAAHGVTGAAHALDGDFGLPMGYSAQPAPERLTEDLGIRWALTGIGIKPYPSCRLTHGAIDAARRLREALGGVVPDGGELTVVVSPAAYAIVGAREPRKIDPLNSVDAQFSVYFQIAAALLDGSVSWNGYRRIGDPEISRLTARIHVTEHVDVKEAGARLTWHAPDGATRTEQVDDPQGEPGVSLSWDMVETKFHAAADAVYGTEPRHALIAAIRTLHEAPTVTRLLELLRTS